MDYLPLLVVAVPALLALVVWLPRWRMGRIVGRRAPPVSGPDGVPGDGLFYFSSPDCWQCRPVTRAVDALAAQGRRVVRVDISHSAELAQRFGVRQVPAVIAVEDGRVTRVWVGPRSARGLARCYDLPAGREG